MVEFALVLPLLLMFVAVSVDLGRLFYAYVAVENAAKEGAMYGARHPLCVDSTQPTCPDPLNVQWVVQNEADNLVDSGGHSLLTTQTTCRDLTDHLVQPINDCVDGETYVVNVTYPFQMVTPILGSIIGPSLTLSSTSRATVIGDAFDPTGLEPLVWVSGSGAANQPTIATTCALADPTNSPGFYYAPCQDSMNLDNYLQFAEGQSVTFKVRIRNTGNINLTNLAYTFQANGTSIAKPAACNSLPTSIDKGGADVFCTFSLNVTATGSTSGEYTLIVGAQGKAGGLATGQTAGAATVKVGP